MKILGRDVAKLAGLAVVGSALLMMGCAPASEADVEAPADEAQASGLTMPWCDFGGHPTQLADAIKAKISARIASYFSATGLTVASTTFSMVTVGDSFVQDVPARRRANLVRVEGTAVLSNGTRLRFSPNKFRSGVEGGYRVLEMGGVVKADEVTVNGSLTNPRCMTEVLNDSRVEVFNASTNVMLTNVGFDNLEIYRVPTE
jgi:hypothetical protein